METANLNSNRRYAVFLSYRHADNKEQGRQWATWLHQVLEGYDNDALDQFVPGMEDVREGGAAMMAYAYLQFSNVPEEQKQLIRNALLRYCELDTMAMVMIWEFWGNEIGRFK